MIKFNNSLFETIFMLQKKGLNHAYEKNYRNNLLHSVKSWHLLPFNLR